jgi:hypothetical protein
MNWEQCGSRQPWPISLTENASPDGLPPGRETNPEPSEYEAGVRSTQSRRSVTVSLERRVSLAGCSLSSSSSAVCIGICESVSLYLAVHHHITLAIEPEHSVLVQNPVTEQISQF